MGTRGTGCATIRSAHAEVVGRALDDSCEGERWVRLVKERCKKTELRTYLCCSHSHGILPRQFCSSCFPLYEQFLQCYTADRPLPPLHPTTPLGRLSRQYQQLGYILIKFQAQNYMKYIANTPQNLRSLKRIQGYIGSTHLRPPLSSGQLGKGLQHHVKHWRMLRHAHSCKRTVPLHQRILQRHRT